MKEVPHTTREESRYRLFKSYRELYMGMQSILSEFAAKSGLSLHEFRVLKFIDENKNTSLGALSKNIMCNDSQSSVWVNDLTKKGLVDRVRDAGDRRRLYLRLTAEGKAKLMELASEKSDLHTFLNDALDLTDEETGLLIQLNHRIMNRLQSFREKGK